MSENKQLKHKQAKKKKRKKVFISKVEKKRETRRRLLAQEICGTRLRQGMWEIWDGGNVKKNLKTKTQIGEIIEYLREERVNCLDSCWLLMNLFVW